MTQPRRTSRTAILLSSISVLLLACILTGTSAGGVTVVVATSESTGAGGAAPTTEAPPIADLTATETPAPTPTYTIVHLTTPPGAAGTTRYITDIKTKDYAPQKKAIGGDDYNNNRYERPFTAETMEYLSDVDLTRVEMKIAAPWVYITFEYVEARAAGIGETMYGAEFDTNKDGRGEYLIWGASPPDGNWTTDGVEAWQDTNYDVGWTNPQFTNAPWLAGNGYDKNLVGSGVGDDPDLAWIRQIEGGAKVQLAFKYSAIANAPQFLWNGLADVGVRNPAWFDYNDRFTQEEAGSPYPASTKYYPLKTLFGLDNTCRDAYGFTPVGTEAGLCIYTGDISGTVFRDQNFSNPPATFNNGIFDTGEPGQNKGQVILGQGACPSTGYKTATFGSPGAYSFPNLPIGSYCVNFTVNWGGGPVGALTSPPHVSVTITPGEHEVVNFGLNWIDPPD
jgi:hypothetical protein